MKLKLLLFTMVLSGGIFAQDTIRTLIISEALLFRADLNYIELTNVGDFPINMGQFKLGMLGPYSGDYFTGTRETWLPDKTLTPGESYVIATILDFTEKMHRIDPDHFQQRFTPIELWNLADWQIHKPETNSIAGIDSITPGISSNDFMGVWDGRDGWYLEQHLSENDSVVIDQVNGIFDDDGVNFSKAYDVAGVTEATVNSVLVRKFSVKKGNIDFASARGVGADDSEWIPIPLSNEDEIEFPWRSPFWTVGNHGDFKLNENTLVSSVLTIDWAGKTITAPWGTRRLDDLMKAFEQKPGLGWYYHLSTERADSAYLSARTGDKITIYACGNNVQVETFNILLATPTSSDNIVIPKFRTEDNGYYDENMILGNREVFNVTTGISGMDTVTNGLFGIPYATQVDTLFKYLEKAPSAKWEIIWVDNIKRNDVITGDILKVTAENGSVKEYFIKVNNYRPNHNAYLSSITWPDIPEELKDIYGWVGDTIPGFGSTTFNYILQVPQGIEGIPALIGKTQELNSKIQVTRATSLKGTTEQSTITFTVTAEDDTTINTYTVQLVKELAPDNVQPYKAEPFLSELVFQDIWANGFVEICNPGSEVLDLSNYMFVFAWGGPPDAITGYSSVNDWGSRYRKYIPGYKWVDEANWAIEPGKAVKDLNVNSLVYPGDVFVAGQIADWTVGWRTGNGWDGPSYDNQADVLFNTNNNPWNESYDNWSSAAHEWSNNHWYLFKILNDSIKSGQKPANDPNDFELIETFGMGDNSDWNVGGFNTPGSLQGTNYIRKPQYSKGKTGFKESFGTNPENSEWTWYDLAYWQARGVGWATAFMNCTRDLGKHFFYPTTDYMSTITSPNYRVSEGYSLNESITGIKTGITASDFLSKIVKKNENQTLLLNGAGGLLEGNAVLTTNDTLIVTSADNKNTTKYILNVSEEGMSSNAILTSARYIITIEQQPKSAITAMEAGVGTVKGMEYGTTLRTILANITVPNGASLTVINEDGAYVPLKMLNFDTTYINVTVTTKIYLNVIAENGVTTINYQLVPSSSDNDAFLLSDIYDVVQRDLLIKYVPRGTTANTLLSNLVPSGKATMKLFDKMGHERLDGVVADDDKVFVTSANGQVTRTYYIAKLATEYIQETTYLAYILSNVYGVDQVAYKVAGVSGTETVSAFLAKVSAAPGATAYVVNKDGAVKTTGDINGSDMVKVVSADGKMNVYYTFGPLTSAGVLQANDIQLYPNPTNGEINVSGLKAGYRIQVYNSVGAAIRDINVQNSIERISLRNQPAGMYMITVSNNSKLLVRYKALKK